MKNKITIKLFNLLITFSLIMLIIVLFLLGIHIKYNIDMKSISIESLYAIFNTYVTLVILPLWLFIISYSFLFFSNGLKKINKGTSKNFSF
jgi:hypothetical protein